MANATPRRSEAPTTEDGFLADRRRFWHSATNFMFYVIVALVVLLVVLWWWLV